MVSSSKSYCFINISETINLDDIAEDIIDDITKIDIIIDWLAFYLT